MKNSHGLLSSLLVVAASLGAVAHAQAQGSASASGYNLGTAGNSYMGLNAGQSDFSLGKGTGLYTSDHRDTAFNIYAGSYFNRNLGFELGYVDFGTASRAGGRTEADGVHLSLVGRLPLGDSFNLLGKIGATYGRTEVTSALNSGVASGSEKEFGVSYGVGAEFSFSPQWSAVLQYEGHELKFAGGSRDRVGATTVGLRYRF